MNEKGLENHLATFFLLLINNVKNYILSIYFECVHCDRYFTFPLTFSIILKWLYNYTYVKDKKNETL